MKLLTTDIPFQTSDLSDKGIRSNVQVFRGGDLHATVYRTSDGGVTVKQFDEQAGFVLRTVSGRGGERRYSYSIPTNRFVFDQKIEVATIKGEFRGKPLEARHMRYTYLPDSVLKVGSCDIPVKHYIAEEVGFAVYRKEEIWFSPALMTTLILRSALARYDGSQQSQVKVIELSTDFTRLTPPSPPK